MLEALKPSRLRRIYQSRVASFFLKTWVLAIILGTLTFLLLHFQSNPYLISLVDSSVYVSDPEGFRRFYLDLNGDGNSEEFTFGNIGDSSSCLMVRGATGVVREQWNFKGMFGSELIQLMQSDFDHNGKTEIASITTINSRLYLNVIEPYGSVPILVKDQFIDTVCKKYGSPYSVLVTGPATDLTNDGNDEIIFSFSAGYARQPRKVYVFDLIADSLWSSPFAGNTLSSIIIMDLDQDGKKELSGRCYAPNNYMEDAIAVHDSSSWFIVLDDHLQYKLPPKQLGPVFSQTAPVQVPVKDSLITFVYVDGYRDSIPVSDWYRLRPDYSLEKETFPFPKRFSRPFSFESPKNNRGGLFYNRWDRALFVNSTGQSFPVRNFPKRATPCLFLNTSSGIQEFEYCFLVDGESLTISFYSLEGEELVSIPDVNFIGIKSVSWCGKVNGRYQLYLTGSKLDRWYEVRRNPWEYFRYLVWIALIGGFFGFIKLIRFSQSQDIFKREAKRRELLELQLKSVKNQLDPHFTFNALNGLSYLVLSGKTDRVNSFISHFSKLLRTHLNTYDQALIQLHDEIDFLENYMELQRMRFDDQVKLEVDIQPEVDTHLSVPKMILQTHVENALKHGLLPKIQGNSEWVGLIRISVFDENATTVILIEDNGAGRGYGKGNKEAGVGKGLKVLDQILLSVRQLYKISISQEFEDLTDNEGRPTGTRVRIEIR